DALTIVVSEETGKVSVTKDGRLTHDITPKDLMDVLGHLQNPNSDKAPRKKARNLFLRKGGKP
ncbi:MAG: TIGR00159 family protein, partial [Lachnospiraceae bacterium]|nr:TIGR00159 family protein [Lachnospiraceae bacterium]